MQILVAHPCLYLGLLEVLEHLMNQEQVPSCLWYDGVGKRK